MGNWNFSTFTFFTKHGALAQEMNFIMNSLLVSGEFSFSLIYQADLCPIPKSSSSKQTVSPSA